MYSICCRPCLAALLLLPTLQTCVLAQDSDLPPWVTASDTEFCELNFDRATGSQEARSVFAWQLFARLHQPVVAETETGEETFAAWELWASNLDTFPPTGPRKPPASRKGPAISDTAKKALEGQEVTRNDTINNFILKRKLFKASVTQKVLGTPTPNGSPRIDLPVGSMETKAQWITNAEWQKNGYGDKLPDDMYTIVGAGGKTYGLQAIHIMAKIKVYPDGPRGIDDPSWFWTTFEYYNNPNRKYLIDFVTYPDTLSADEIQSLLNEAGLEDSPYCKTVDVPMFDSATGKTTTVKGNNYLCNGTQYRFVGPNPASKQMVNVILGNSILESDFVVESPAGSKNPFRGWNASCHSCHYEAAGNDEYLTGVFHSVTGHVLLGHDAKGKKLYPIDFEWSIPFAEQPRTK